MAYRYHRLLPCAGLLLTRTFAAPAQTAPPPDTARVALGEVVVAASRTEESWLKAPVAVEKLSARAIRRSPAPSFFDALATVPGVQVITPSLGFRVVNTRGFANTTNVRFAQLVDGLDQQAPHLGAPIGNALGPSDLDIASVEIVPGTAAALYGLNAVNGLASFVTRNPFDSEGLTGQQKTGVNHLGDAATGAHAATETSVRWARVLAPRLALKVSGTYLRGTDWVADDRRDLAPNANATVGLTGGANPATDPVNGYGNESANRRTLTLGGKSYAVARTGYSERDVADYSLQTIKADAAVHYRLTEKVQLAYTYRFALIDNVYQRSNRFRLEEYRVQQHGLTLTGGAVQVRAFLTDENTGHSYNLRSAAENLDRVTKTDDQWFAAYSAAFRPADASTAAVAAAHQQARAQADAGRLQPGSAEFNQNLARLSGINNWDAGAALRVRAQLAGAETQVNLTQAQPNSFLGRWQLDALVGADYRTYLIHPDGNYFINPEPGRDGRTLTYGKTGGFAQLGRAVWRETLRLTATVRVDKNDYFGARVNPRLTAVYAPVPALNLRVAYQSGYRFPSIFEGFSNVNSGGVKRVGGLRVMSDGVFESSYLRASVDAFQAAVTRDFNVNGVPRAQAIEQNRGLLRRNDYTYLRPEFVRSWEAGYRGALLRGRLVVDVAGYLNRYRDFIAQVEANVPKLAPTATPDSVPTYLNDKKQQTRYRLWTNSHATVTNYGATASARYELSRGYLAGVSATFARLDHRTNTDGLEDGFNTPQWTYNASLANERAFGRLGFGVNYRWQNGYYWQSFLVNGDVPAYGTLDAQLTYALLGRAAPDLTVKLGATNLTNRYYRSFLGGPSIGGFYYLTLTVRVP